MTKYDSPPWLARFPKSRVPAYPPHRGSMRVDAVIVGGGLTGCATAYALAAAGMNAVLLESERMGRGATGSSSGWVAEDPGISFVDLERAIGLRHARHAWQSWRRAALDFSALLRRLDIKCYLEPRESLTAAMTPEQVARLRKDQKARVAAGLEAPFINARAVASETGLSAGGAIRGRDGATLDPYRACIGLAAAAAARRARLFERSPVRRITFTRRDAEVHTAGGAIRTRRVVIATGFPTALFKSLRRHFWFRTRYAVLTDAVPAKVRQALGTRTTVVRDIRNIPNIPANAPVSDAFNKAEPPHVVRWVDDNQMLVTGADAPTPPPGQREKVVVQRTGQLMYELSTLYPDVSGIQPAHGWATDYALTAEGLPYIGPHRNFPHQVFAFGDSSQGVTGAYLASRILLRHCSGEMDPADEAFGFHR
ncbi:MAG TPA: FAD-dependent oxidoreductase [Vicinamibacterales bacterium]|nr:FAD-dependent oxidoreductase [Vicinamibacterales bacterium]